MHEGVIGTEFPQGKSRTKPHRGQENIPEGRVIPGLGLESMPRNAEALACGQVEAVWDSGLWGCRLAEADSGRMRGLLRGMGT